MEQSSDLTRGSALPDIKQVQEEARTRAVPYAWLYTFPWWALILAVVGVWVFASIAADDLYSSIFDDLREGIELTLRVSFLAYGLALVIGLMVGIIRSSLPKPRTGIGGNVIGFFHVVLYNLATLFVEIVRGLPILIVLLIAAFIIVPAINDQVQAIWGIPRLWRGSSWETATLALGLAYGAFLSEVFRAGIQSIGKGQVEAARSLGMTYVQTMRYVVLPQAIRRIVPPLGNDFIAMIKDSSLVAILAIPDIAHIAKTTSGSNFQYVPTYLTVAVLYLTMTIIGSLMVRLVENVLQTRER
jgi:polar amino acid transport system permease protein